MDIEIFSLWRKIGFANGDERIFDGLECSFYEENLKLILFCSTLICKFSNSTPSLWQHYLIHISNIKGLEIVGQIVIYDYQNEINAWKKCSYVEHNVCSNFLKMYKVFCLKELSGAIKWEQLSGRQVFGG